MAPDDFLAAPGWAGDEHRGVARREQTRQPIDGLHDARVADHSGQRSFENGRGRGQILVFGIVHCQAFFR
jgi:hypothetical protein